MSIGQTFFGARRLPATSVSPKVSPVVVNNIAQPPPPVVTNDERLFFAHLEYANIAEGGAAHDFTYQLFKMLRFDHDKKLITRRRPMTFMMCGDHICAEADVAVMKDNNFSLVVKAAKPSTIDNEPVPQLIAEVIAAFVENNRRRRHPLPQQIIPAITMVGPRPIFYKVPVTQDLVSSLSTGQYPSQPTIVQRLVPPVADKEAYMVHGMNPLADRRVVFRCLKAMGALL